MRSIFARLILALVGWKVGPPPPTLKKYVMIAAPHTTSWDVPLLVLFGWVYNMKINWMMKAEMFRGWRGPFFKKLGGIPIDRSKTNNMVQQSINLLTAAEELVMVVPPEGTRSAAKGWRTGFYYIAHGANVPIAMGFLDYKNRIGGFGPLLYPTGDIEKDFEQLRAFYRADMGKYPEKFGEVRVRPDAPKIEVSEPS